MKISTTFITELAITVIAALLLSAVLATILLFISGNLGWGETGQMYASSISTGVFGLIVGYKLNTLIKQNKK